MFSVKKQHSSLCDLIIVKEPKNPSKKYLILFMLAEYFEFRDNFIFRDVVCMYVHKLIVIENSIMTQNEKICCNYQNDLLIDICLCSIES